MEEIGFAFRQAALVRLGESHTDFHRPVKRYRK